MPIELKFTFPGQIETLTISKIPSNFWERLAVGFRDAGEVLVEQIKRNLSGPGRGPAPSQRSRKIFADRRRNAEAVSRALGETTIRREPFSRLNNFPGVVTGALRRSVKMKLEGSGEALTLVVGPNRVYAARQEFGYDGTQPVTPRMRGYLHSQGIHLKATTTTIRQSTPPRPYVWPAYERRRSEVVGAISDAIMKD